MIDMPVVDSRFDSLEDVTFAVARPFKRRGIDPASVRIELSQCAGAGGVGGGAGGGAAGGVEVVPAGGGFPNTTVISMSRVPSVAPVASRADTNCSRRDAEVTHPAIAVLGATKLEPR